MDQNTDEGCGCLLICIGLAILIIVVAWVSKGMPGLAR